MRPDRAIAISLASLLATALAACATTRSETTLEDPATLLAERDEWRGSRDGAVVLRYHVEALVDARPNASRAESRLIVHLVVASYAGPTPELAIPLPAGARRTHTTVRLSSPTSPPQATDKLSETITSSDIDPGLMTARLTLPTPPENGVTEAILEYTIPGTLGSDARWLGFEGVPTAEVLLRYSLPSHSAGRFTTTLPNARPLETEKDGRTLKALLAQNLPPLPPLQSADRPLARYVTTRVAPLGFEADLATTWRAAAAPYYAGLVDRSPALTDGYEVPHRPKDPADALAWTQARPGPTPDPNAAHPWDRPKTLPDAIAKNTLTAVDKVHLMAWLLREAKLPFVFAIARPAALPPIAADFPTPGAFSVPLLFLPTLQAFADPGCTTCTKGQVGEVREALRGGTALLLPPSGLEPTLVPLPVSPSK